MQSLLTRASRFAPRLRNFRAMTTYNITYIEPSGDPVTVSTDNAEENLMTLAVKNNVDLEGACDGQLACSTCHCILPKEVFDDLQVKKPPTDEELDLLDTAIGLSNTSRLGCQLPLKVLPTNLTVTLPSYSR